jgi:hypothetical protein
MHNLRLNLLLVALTAAATCGVTALLLNIHTRKMEARVTHVRLQNVTEDDTELAAAVRFLSAYGPGHPHPLRRARRQRGNARAED